MRTWRNRFESLISFRSGEGADWYRKWIGPQRKTDHEKTLYDDYRWGEREVKRYYFASLMGFGLLGWLFYQHWLGMAISGLLSLPFRGVYSGYRLDKQRRQGYQELREILYILSSSFGSGYGLKDGIRDCSQMLRSSYGEHSLLEEQINLMLRAMEEGNASEVDLLYSFASRSGFPELKQLASIYQLCLRTGGNLPQAMIETSDSILRRLQMWEEIQAKTSQKRLEFTCMIVMIPLLLTSVNGTSNYLEPLYSTFQGRVVMTIALIFMNVSFLWSIRIFEGGKR